MKLLKKSIRLSKKFTFTLTFTYIRISYRNFEMLMQCDVSHINLSMRHSKKCQRYGGMSQTTQLTKSQSLFKSFLTLSSQKKMK